MERRVRTKSQRERVPTYSSLHWSKNIESDELSYNVNVYPVKIVFNTYVYLTSILQSIAIEK